MVLQEHDEPLNIFHGQNLIYSKFKQEQDGLYEPKKHMIIH